MATFVKRVQTVLTPDQYATLETIAEESGKPISWLVREAIERVYFRDAEAARRQAALATLLALDAPVADWPQMEDEIIEGALE